MLQKPAPNIRGVRVNNKLQFDSVKMGLDFLSASEIQKNFHCQFFSLYKSESILAYSIQKIVTDYVLVLYITSNIFISYKIMSSRGGQIPQFVIPVFWLQPK